MLKAPFSNRLFLGALAFFVLCVGGSLLYMQHVKKQSARELAETQERIKAITEKQTPTAEAPVEETLQHGRVHAAPREPVETLHDGSQSETSLTLEEKIRAHQQWVASAEGQKVINAAYKQAGLEPPPPNHYYVKDENGVFQLHSIFEPVVQIRLIDGFAPTPAQLERYLDLQESLSDAMRRDAYAEVDRIRSEIETLRYEARGKVPQAIGSWMTKAAKSKVDFAMREKTAQAYRDLGLGHMVKAGVSGLPEIKPTGPH